MFFNYLKICKIKGNSLFKWTKIETEKVRPITFYAEWSNMLRVRRRYDGLPIK